MLNEIKAIKEHEEEIEKKCGTKENFLQEIATRHFRGQENRQTSSRIVRIIGGKKRSIKKFFLSSH